MAGAASARERPFAFLEKPKTRLSERSPRSSPPVGALGYYLALPFLYGIALLPFPLLYGLSDLIFVLLYHILGYRKEVVRTNLARSFPEKSEAERRTIERRFYRWLCDLMLETLKTLTLTRAQALARLQVEGE